MGVKPCQHYLSRGVAFQLWDRNVVSFGLQSSELSQGHAVCCPPQTLCQRGWSVAPLLLAVLLIRSLISASSLISGFPIGSACSSGQYAQAWGQCQCPIPLPWQPLGTL